MRDETISNENTGLKREREMGGGRQFRVRVRDFRMRQDYNCHYTGINLDKGKLWIRVSQFCKVRFSTDFRITSLNNFVFYFSTSAFFLLSFFLSFNSHSRIVNQEMFILFNVRENSYFKGRRTTRFF